MSCFTLPVCVLLVLIKNNQVFLLHRAATGWSDGLYGLPGGHLEENETVQEAGIREAAEEIGITITPTDLIFLEVSHVKTTREYIAFSFQVVSWQGEPYNKEPHKHSDGTWFALTQLPHNLHPYTATVLNAYPLKQFYTEYGWQR